MKKPSSFLFFLSLFSLGFLSPVLAQDDLFGTERVPPRKGWVFSVNANLDFPGGDMKDRFGTSYRVGPGILYKTENNWIFGPKMDFIAGGIIREDSLLINIRDEVKLFIGQDGERTEIKIYERGYVVGLQAGKIFPFRRSANQDRGWLVMTSLGFIQHKIHFFDRDEKILSLGKEERKGYDRLANGLVLEQYLGYNHFAPNGLINFHIGLNLTAGFTQGRRDFIYDVRRPGTEQRLDLLFGIRAGWYIPIFRKKSEEIFFE